MDWTFSQNGQTKEEHEILTLEHLVGDKLKGGGGDWYTDIYENQQYSQGGRWLALG